MGLKQTDSALGVARSTVSQIENGGGSGRDDATLLALCRALRWEERSIEDILAGGEPTMVSDGAEDPVQERLAAVEREVAANGQAVNEIRELLKQLIAALNRNGDPDPVG